MKTLMRYRSTRVLCLRIQPTQNHDLNNIQIICSPFNSVLTHNNIS